MGKQGKVSLTTVEGQTLKKATRDDLVDIKAPLLYCSTTRNRADVGTRQVIHLAISFLAQNIVFLQPCALPPK
jgi:hypothetical protein